MGVYLVLKVDWGGVVDESDETNNTLAALIEVPPSNAPPTAEAGEDQTFTDAEVMVLDGTL